MASDKEEGRLVQNNDYIIFKVTGDPARKIAVSVFMFISMCHVTM